MSPTTRQVQFILFALLAACAGGSLPSNGSHPLLPVNIVQPRASQPPSLLYVAGGPTSEPHPFIEVFNAEDASPSPTPIYTIAPIGGGSYGYFAVDRFNDLLAVNYFTNGAKLLVFPSGKAKPMVSCLLDNVPQGMYIAHSTLYLTTASFTIEEYALPIHAGHICPKPNRVLTDQRAKLRGTGALFGVAVDPNGDIFDTWEKGTAGDRIDEFPAGSSKALGFASLGNSFDAFYMVSDSSGNLITNISGTGKLWDSIAMFPHGSHIPKRFHPIDNGAYSGFAIAHGGTELFAEVNYPINEVEVFAYDSTTGKVGRRLRTFTDVWYYAQDISVFSHK